VSRAKGLACVLAATLALGLAALLACSGSSRRASTSRVRTEPSKRHVTTSRPRHARHAHQHPHPHDPGSHHHHPHPHPHLEGPNGHHHPY
jgi:hypothetical protein